MNVFVANLHPSTRGEDLKVLFADYGNLLSAKVIMDKVTGKSKRFGFVEVESEEMGEKAISELNESEFQGNTIVVKHAIKKD